MLKPRPNDSFILQLDFEQGYKHNFPFQVGRVSSSTPLSPYNFHQHPAPSHLACASVSGGSHFVSSGSYSMPYHALRHQSGGDPSGRYSLASLLSQAG
jgi:hypothetical protein